MQNWILYNMYCSFSMRRQMAPQQTAKFRTAFLVDFFTSLRKDSVANYAWIWTAFWWLLLSCVTTGCSLQRTKRFVVPSVGGVTIFVNLRWKLSKTPKNSAAELVIGDWFIVQWSTTGCKGCTNNTNIHPHSQQKPKNTSTRCVWIHITNSRKLMI